MCRLERRFRGPPSARPHPAAGLAAAPAAARRDLPRAARPLDRRFGVHVRGRLELLSRIRHRNRLCRGASNDRLRIHAGVARVRGARSARCSRTRHPDRCAGLDPRGLRRRDPSGSRFRHCASNRHVRRCRAAAPAGAVGPVRRAVPRLAEGSRRRNGHADRAHSRSRMAWSSRRMRR